MWRQQVTWRKISKAVPWSVERFDSIRFDSINDVICNFEHTRSSSKKAARSYVHVTLHNKKHLQYTPIDISTSSNDAM